jgi:hypothetical protein
VPKQANANAISKIDLGQLIEHLGPLNNQWRDGSQAEKALALWEMGEVLLNSVADPSDKLLWEIQGRSYLTRITLRYALIVRRGWPSRGELEKLIRGLRSYTVFREALPFLKGNREGIDEATHDRVVSPLSNPDTQAAMAYLKKLKAQKIGRQHQRGVSAAGLQEHASDFLQALSQLEATVLADEVTESDESLIRLSQIAVAIATVESVKGWQVDSAALPGQFSSIAEPLRLATQGGRSAVGAFRKAVGTERLMQAADLLNSLRSAETLAEWRRRRGVKLSFATAR